MDHGRKGGHIVLAGWAMRPGSVSRWGEDSPGEGIAGDSGKHHRHSSGPVLIPRHAEGAGGRRQESRRGSKIVGGSESGGGQQRGDGRRWGDGRVGGSEGVGGSGGDRRAGGAAREQAVAGGWESGRWREGGRVGGGESGQWQERGSERAGGSGEMGGWAAVREWTAAGEMGEWAAVGEIGGWAAAREWAGSGRVGDSGGDGKAGGNGVGGSEIGGRVGGGGGVGGSERVGSSGGGGIGGWAAVWEMGEWAAVREMGGWAAVREMGERATRRLDLQRGRLAGGRSGENLHATAETGDRVEGRLLPDAVTRKGMAVRGLSAGGDGSLLAEGWPGHSPLAAGHGEIGSRRGGPAGEWTAVGGWESGQQRESRGKADGSERGESGRWQREGGQRWGDGRAGSGESGRQREGGRRWERWAGVRERAAAGERGEKGQVALLAGGDPLPVLNRRFHASDSIRRPGLQRDRPAGGHFDENLHATAKTGDRVEGGIHSGGGWETQQAGQRRAAMGRGAAGIESAAPVTWWRPRGRGGWATVGKRGVQGAGGRVAGENSTPALTWQPPGYPTGGTASRVREGGGARGIAAQALVRAGGLKKNRRQAACCQHAALRDEPVRKGGGTRGIAAQA
ncbi:hypothetical protein BD779DRAFT_1471225 [Infundibulicybe gibba]|nr:hypothetical protein BD779DRAFT_1471225 [Infundibulicybe gibba]